MSSGQILLVEDNPDDADLTLRAFRKNNILNDICVARDGVEALDCLLGRGDMPPTSVLPAVVLLDLKLPRIDGLGVLRRIRTDERTRFLPVVVLTSSTDERDIVDAYRLGANWYSTKAGRLRRVSQGHAAARPVLAGAQRGGPDAERRSDTVEA